MKIGKFSIAGLIFAVALMALGLAALHSANDLWARAAFSLAVLTTLVSAVGSLFAGRSFRAFSCGYLIFSATYLWLAFLRPIEIFELPVANRFNPSRDPTRKALITDPLLDAFFNLNDRRVKLKQAEKIQVLWGNAYWTSTVLEVRGDQTYIHYDGDSGASNEWVGPDRIDTPAHARPYFICVGHCLFAIILGFAGGVVARIFQATRRDLKPS